MKYILLIFFLLNLKAFSSIDLININFKNLKIVELIKITSNKLNKNILFGDEIKGNVNFISNQSIKKDELLSILEFTLNEKGYKLLQNKDILKIVKFDNNSVFNNKQIESIKIKNFDVKSLLKVLNKILTSNNFFQKELIKPVITIEEESNSIVIAGLKKDIIFLKNFIKKIDVNKAQIYVRAKILEISETKTKDIGLEYGLKGFDKYNSSTLSTFSSSLNSMTNNSTDFSSFANYGFDITSLSKALSLNASINFLKQNEAVDVISEPSILCVNNKISSIYVGETKSFKTGQTTNETGTSESYKREEIGLRLKVKPRISDNKIILEINTVLEDAKSSTTSENLDTSKKEIITTAILNNGESVVIGGLIKSKKFEIKSAIPLLSDLPILGTLFKNERFINDKINLVVVITPYIVPFDSSLTIIKNEVDYLKSLEDIYLSSFLKKVEKKKQEKKDYKMNSPEKIMKEFGY